ncbi:MAG TPA: site-2 protease family protein, partial [Pyrinomonadaceae bacterium]|nr:site-2 protease family protein [Pyrinomonadaceae bacterium]
IYVLIALLIALTIHEASHALMAYWLGDSTPKKMGRLSLNPFAHLEPLGALMILLIGFGWGKPVQIDAEKLKPGPKLGMTLVAAAGPISNFLLAVLFVLPLRLKWFPLYGNIRIPLDGLPFGVAAFYTGVGPLLQTIVTLSLALAIFNLIPLNPLDGSRLWEIILPTKLYFQIARFELIGLALVLGLIVSDRFLGTNILAGFLGPPVDFLFRKLMGFA